MSHHTIMVVEDNPVTRRMVRVALEHEGFLVQAAPDGTTALDLAASAMPDLILQDLVLPDIDGFTLIQRLRKLPGGNSTPMLAFTGFVSKVEDAHISASGFNGLLVKPVEPSRLVAVVNEYLARPHQVRPGLERRRVLLVDDDPTLLKLHRIQLEQLGFVVETAGNGEEALDQARHSPPDVILSDVLMPKLDGFHLAAAVRADPRLGGVPLVLISAHYVEPDDQRVAERAGAQAILMRTHHVEHVAQTLVTAIERGVNPAAMTSPFVQDEAYLTRVVRQLERQATLNLGLSQRVSLQAAALTVLASISDTLCGSTDVGEALEGVLSQCVDAAGLSSGAILVGQADGAVRIAARIGITPAAAGHLVAACGPGRTLRERLEQRVPQILSPASATDADVQDLLSRLGASSVLIAPMPSSGRNIGALVLISATRTLGGAEWQTFAQSIAAQLGQAIALTRTFAELQQSERRYRALFEEVPAALIRTSLDGRVREANRAMRRVLGYEDRDEFLAIPAGNHYVDALDRDRLFEALLAGQDQARGFRTRLHRRDGRIIDVDVTASLVRDAHGDPVYCEASLLDVTERLAAEARLRKSEERFTQLAENINEVFFITDTAGNCSYVSPAYASIWGRPCDTVYRRPWALLDAIHPDDVAGFTAAFQTLPDGEGGNICFRVVLPDGSMRWMRSRSFVIRDHAEHPAQLVGVFEDITELRQTEQQLHHAQKMEAIGQLAGGIAHDFNNVLAAITVFTELVTDDLPAESGSRADLDQVQTAVQQARRLTRQLLAFSRQQVLKPVVLDPAAAIGDMRKILDRLIGENITLVTECDPAAGHIRVDPGQLEQVLMNLAINARDAMPDGGTLTMRTVQATLSPDDAKGLGLARPGDYVALIVADTGTGMTPQVQARIFEPFFTTKEGKGTGLGLATVYGIVRQSDGHVSVLSEPGEGTVFTILLPAMPAPAASHGFADQALPPLGGTETILLAEDEPAVRFAATAVLERLGYTVIAATNGNDALEKALQSARPIDLLITDVVMPGMSGPDLVRRLTSVRGGIKMLLTSGYAGDELRQREITASGLPYLEKPFSSATLARKVREVFDAVAVA